jgi:hypothetical protein
MKISKQLLAKEVDAFLKTGLLETKGRSSKRDASPLELLNERTRQSKQWLFLSAAILEAWLFAQNGNDTKQDINPLLIYISAAQSGRHLTPHPLIDAKHLCKALPEHYQLKGHTLLYSYLQLPPHLKGEISPTPWFDPKIYLQYNTDLHPEHRAEPFVHFLLQGARDCRPASTRFDPNKWITQEHKMLHPIPLVDYLLKRHRNPKLRPTRPNLPGEITSLNSDGVLQGWVKDPDAEAAPEVSIWWKKLCLSKAQHLPPEGFAARQVTNQSNFNAQLPAWLAEDLAAAAERGELNLLLRTSQGDEVGSPKGWHADAAATQQLTLWQQQLDEPAINTNHQDNLQSPTAKALELELNTITHRLREHERRLRERLSKGGVKPLAQD